MQKIIILFFFLFLLLFYKFATMSKVEEHYTDVEKAKIDTLKQVANMFVSAGGNEVTVPVKVNFPQGVNAGNVTATNVTASNVIRGKQLNVGNTILTQDLLVPGGRFHIKGNERLYLLPKQGVHVTTDMSGKGTLDVRGALNAGNVVAANMTASNNIATKNMTASNNITATNMIKGKQLNAGTTSLTQTDLSPQGIFHINGNKKLYILPKEGVHMTTNRGGKGTLYASGNITTPANVKAKQVQVNGIHYGATAAQIESIGVKLGDRHFMYPTKIPDGRELMTFRLKGGHARHVLMSSGGWV
jgi:hypothetical protein